MRRRRFVFRGTVQGVGFRPAVWRHAEAHGLAGFVQNRRSHVVAEVEGSNVSVAAFETGLAAAFPPAARVEGIDAVDVDPRGEAPPFRIDESLPDQWSFPPIPPDLPLCADCARELLDPGNRRYLYPFITCTQCGPRYSIVERTPFDRAATTMAPFVQCPACRAEYESPPDRRFHSQTNSCAACGPRLACTDDRGAVLPGDPVLAAISALDRGLVVALQGIGGFHLAVDPRRPGAVARLRRDKERLRKPFALMVRDVQEARELCDLSGAEESLLLSAEAPIVIALRRGPAPAQWLQEVSGTDTLGLMLPYTPLHLLLFRHPGAAISWRHLVMTSGNRAGEPIVTDPADARVRLAGAADAFLWHDRVIAFRTDDSVVRAGKAAPPFFLRRSRGWVPRLIRLGSPVDGVVLGVGGDLKSAPALARGRDVHLSAYNGDLDDEATHASFVLQVSRLQALYGVEPDVIAHDLHPLYRSSAWALGRRGARGPRLLGVQHHHAHALSVMAEHGLDDCLALCFDGTGFGTDGTIWGGEFLRVTRAGFERMGSFSPFPLPGGDAAVAHPSRTALAVLGDAARPGEIPGLQPSEEEMLRAMIAREVNCPRCSSLGRVFDAAAAILGLVVESAYEGEGPVRLEGLATRAWPVGAPRARRKRPSPALVHVHSVAPASGDGRLFEADPRPLLRHLLDRRGRADAHELALLFHAEIARAAAAGAGRMRKATGCSRIALSGGVFQNLLLRETLVPLLKNGGFEVFLNEQAPPGDGGIAVGQAWYVEREGLPPCASRPP